MTFDLCRSLPLCPDYKQKKMTLGFFFFLLYFNLGNFILMDEN